MNATKVLWGTRKGAEEWQEELITDNPEHLESARAWAIANGFDRLRVSVFNPHDKPDFTKVLAKPARKPLGR